MSRRVMTLALNALDRAAAQIDVEEIDAARKELRATLSHPDYMEGPHRTPPPMSHADWLDMGMVHGWVKITAHTLEDFK